MTSALSLLLLTRVLSFQDYSPPVDCTCTMICFIRFQTNDYMNNVTNIDKRTTEIKQLTKKIVQHCQMIQGYRLERSKLQCIEIIIFPRPFQITQIKEKLRLLLSESFCQLFLKNCRDECSCGLHKCTEWALKCLISMMRREKYFCFITAVLQPTPHQITLALEIEKLFAYGRIMR